MVPGPDPAIGRATLRWFHESAHGGIATTDTHVTGIRFLSPAVPAKAPKRDTLAFLACVQLQAYLENPRYAFDLPLALALPPPVGLLGKARSSQPFLRTAFLDPGAQNLAARLVLGVGPASQRRARDERHADQGQHPSEHGREVRRPHLRRGAHRALACEHHRGHPGDAEAHVHGIAQRHADGSGGREAPARLGLVAGPAVAAGHEEDGDRLGLGIAAQLLGRADVDAYGLRSQHRAASAWRQGHFDREVSPIRAPVLDEAGEPTGGTRWVERDEGLRETTAEALARLEPNVAGGVLFNRFYQPDIDLETREVVPTLTLSTPYEALLRIHWVAALYGQVGLSLVVLVSAGLFLRSLRNAASIDPGFRTRSLALGTYDVGLKNSTLEVAEEVARYASSGKPAMAGTR